MKSNFVNSSVALKYWKKKPHQTDQENDKKKTRSCENLRYEKCCDRNEKLQHKLQIGALYLAPVWSVGAINPTALLRGVVRWVGLTVWETKPF